MIDLRNLMRLSLFDPRQGAGLLAYQLSTEAVFYLFAASVCVSTAMMFGMQILLTNGEAAGLIAAASPWMFALLVAGMTMMVWVNFLAGQKFEGTGDFRAVFTVMVGCKSCNLFFRRPPMCRCYRFQRLPLSCNWELFSGHYGFLWPLSIEPMNLITWEKLRSSLFWGGVWAWW